MGATGAAAEWNPVWLTLFILIAVLILAGVTAFVIYARSRISLVREEVTRKYRSQNILFRDDFANLCGIESLGKGQVSGNGVVLLTETLFIFNLFMPRRETIVPREMIRRIEMPAYYMGKARLKPVVKLT